VLVLKDGKTAVAIVSLDLIVFASSKVVREAKAKSGVDHVIVSATHTHAATAPRGLLIQPPSRPDWTRPPPLQSCGGLNRRWIPLTSGCCQRPQAGRHVARGGSGSSD
jgi:hypothetical protein